MKKLLFTLLAVTATLAMNAEQVSRQEALKKAQQFMPGKSFIIANSPNLVRGDESSIAETELYILNADGGGFVIVSGDDRTEPIIGYSDKGEFRLDNMPDNVRKWLDSYVEQIKSIEKGTQPVRAGTRGAAKPAILPMIQTEWNQGSPYNRMCPTSGTTNCLTGCVATALAQVMYYYKWPEQSPAIPQYSIYSTSLPEIPATTFKWDLMKKSYQYTDTDDAADAVAELMRYVGQACEAIYGSDATAASIKGNAFAKYFGYSKEMRFVNRDQFYCEQWESMIYSELENNRPVLYSGSSAKEGGHQFICDGYDGNGLFHINWGWGGFFNGYFVLSLANDQEEGVGPESGTSGFAYGQEAVLHFHPASGDELEIPQIRSSVANFVSAEYNRESADLDFENVSTSQCYLSGYYPYIPTTTCSVETGWALFQNGNMLKILASNSQQIDLRSYQVGSSPFYYAPKSITFGAGLADGEYQIVNVFRLVGETDWQLCEGSEVSYLIAVINGNSLTLSRTGSGFKDAIYTVNEVTYDGDMAAGSEVRVTANITNTGTTVKEMLYLWLKYDGQWKKVASEVGIVEPGKTGMVNLLFTPTTTGSFDLKITTDSDGLKEVYTSTLSIYPVEEITIDRIIYSCNTGTLQAKVIGNTVSIDDESRHAAICSNVSIGSVSYTVTEIAEDAFAEGRITSVTLPNTIKKIANRAFYNTPLVEVTIPEGVEVIGNDAFSSCFQLKLLDLPSSLKRIGNGAFYSCGNLNTVVARMDNPCQINEEVFLYTKNVDDEWIRVFSSAELFVPASSKQKYSEAPVWKQFKAIHGGEFKKLILDGVTYYCVTGECIANVIGGDADVLRNKDVTILSKVQSDGITFDVKTIADRAFQYVYFNSLIVEDGIEAIGEGAFLGCYQLKEMDLPSTLKSIGANAFYNCRELSSIVARMADPLIIEDNVFTVSYYVNGSSVKKFCSATLYVPVGSKTKYATAPVWKEFGTIYEGEPRELIQNGITYSYITGEGFATVVKGDKEVLKDQDVTIPSAIEVDGTSYPVKSIADRAFSSVQMKSLTIESGIETIGNEAFWNSYYLKEIVIPEGVKSIGDAAFQYLSRAEKIVLPSTLVSIGEKIIYTHNSSLISVVVRMKAPIDICENTFIVSEYINEWTDVFSSATLYVPVGSAEKYRQADIWNRFEHIVEMLIGDANGDGKVDAADIVAIVNHLKGNTPVGFVESLADADQNGQVTEADLDAVARIIMK